MKIAKSSFCYVRVLKTIWLIIDFGLLSIYDFY